MVRKLLGDLEEAGHIEKVNCKPLIISPLNLVPKSNGSPRLIHNLKALNNFLKRGPSISLLIPNFSKNNVVSDILIRKNGLLIPNFSKNNVVSDILTQSHREILSGRPCVKV